MKRKGITPAAGAGAGLPPATFENRQGLKVA
jgi:hypothetical protein